FGYGPRAIFLPTIAVYWLGFLTVFLALRRDGGRIAWLVLAVGFLPPTFALIGVIWRDVIFSACWLLAFGLAMLGARWTGYRRAAATVPAALIFLIGFWLRPNALF